MRRTSISILAAAGLIVLAASCSKDSPTDTGNPPDDTTVTPPPPPPPAVDTPATIALAGNVSRCATVNDDLTAQIIDTMPATTVVIALGDNALPYGRAADYGCYDAAWGRFKARTFAVLGNHEYDSSVTADAAITYFGNISGPAGQGYYSFNVGKWHIIVLNVSDASGSSGVLYNAASPQQAWLQADLDANATTKCIMAVWHDPRFLSSATFTERTQQASLWSRLQAAGVDVIVNGGQHQYERMFPMMADGSRNDSLGITQFNSGLGGDSRAAAPAMVNANQATFSVESFGVLKMRLFKDRYEFAFQSVSGGTFSDAGSANCH